MASRHLKRSIPAYLAPSSFMMSISASPWRLPTRKSFGSCAGVIFTIPVPNSFST